MYVHHMHAGHLWRSEESMGSLGPGVMIGCEPPHGCWGPNPGRLQEEQVLLSAEPSLWSPEDHAQSKKEPRCSMEAETTGGIW